MIGQQCSVVLREDSFYMKFGYLFILILSLGLSACQSDQPLFQKLDAGQTGVHFINQLQETEQENILAFEYFYNGGGIAVGDLNNDGLPDLFFTGNQVENRLYVNKGDFAFEDVTRKAGVAGRPNGWKTGVTLVDINADGWLDIYVCYSGQRPDALRKNQLFINNHDLTFSDQAERYGLADSGYSVQAGFFDYDRDGDLDCFLINHNLKDYQRKEAAVMRTERDYNAGDKLFRNDGNGHFTDVSEPAGIKGNPLGFGLGLSISDLNQDGYPDIYVTNDFVEDDYLYINQRDGTFRDEMRDRIEHTSYSSMGVDVADVNNDGLPDIFTLDMLPESNARQKLLPWPDSWNVYQAQLLNGFWHQNMRNMLQIQQSNGQFAEIGQLAGVSNTDWSWGTLLADFDLDGYKDVFVSNGMVRDFTNGDFVKYSDEAEAGQRSPIELIRQMPSTRTKNYIFRNNRNLTFSNQQQTWGFDETATSNGCAYADLDNDGDLDLITNNLNETARIYKNQSREQTQSSYIGIRFNGPATNPFGIGATVTVQTDSLTQTQEWHPTRGFQSCSHGDLRFGLGPQAATVRVTVQWPDGKRQEINGANLNQVLTLDYRQASERSETPKPSAKPFFEEVTAPAFTHTIEPTNNFDRQLLLPMQYSYAGPRMAVGDINADGQPDVFVCGTTQQPGRFFRQTSAGFTPLLLTGAEAGKNTDAVLADFNGDQRPDLYVVNGGYEVRETALLQDQLWLNDGKGGFTPQPLPTETDNGSCVTALDYDRDGDLDLFVGGHIKPSRFPAADESFLLRNDGKAHFTRVSLGKLGLVTDAVPLDLNHDGWPDLVLVGEWMPVTVLMNQKGVFSAEKPRTYETLAGWWNRIEKADLDGDGDDDLVIGNLGLNSQIRTSTEQPATLVYEDFDQNGTIDCFMNYYIQGKSYPAYSRDEIGEQMPSLRKIFTNYQTYSDATIDQFFAPDVLQKAQKKTINEVKTLVLENRDGELVPRPLPLQAQYAPVYGILAHDFDRDGRPDLLLMGNNSTMRLRIGKIDANHGVLLNNRGNWQFMPVSSTTSGIFVKGDVRDVKMVGDYVLVGVNNRPLRVFRRSR
ncbi:VCBS repeat protein [Larkinella arboricola]|uniref:VCBS repeat protein n=2 Tax=Larkinella arboricola TaxID=643671 RepID=A0A327X8J6_LARAB|nr:VCBS repeat protein [Larkinella arboricola]